MVRILSFIMLILFSLAQAEVVPGEWIVKFKDNSGPAMESDSVKDLGRNFYLYKGDEAQEMLTLESDEIEYVQPNFVYRPMLHRSADYSMFLSKDPASQKEILNYLVASHEMIKNFEEQAQEMRTNDPRFNKQWGMKKINIEKAWDITTGNKDIIVAVIDTGVDYNHEDLKDNMWTNTDEIPGNGIDDDNNGYIDDIHGWNFAKNTNDPMDVKNGGNPGHGTHCAGNVGAVGNNGKGISGAAQQVSIMALKFIDGSSGSTAAAIGAINYAIDNGAQILSNSWGSEGTDGGEEDKALQEVITRCADNNILFVAAAGNHSANNDTSKKAAYPASYDHDNIIAVAASTNNDSLAGFSCYGKKTVDIAAPGKKIFSTVPGNKYQDSVIPFLAPWDGTSMAAPHVSGVLALMMAANPDLTVAQLKDALLSTATRGSRLESKVVSGGRVDAGAAVRKASEM